ncbi:MAG: excalibur calcium-binding domain-containing protein [Sphingobium yanoikuyae]
MSFKKPFRAVPMKPSPQYRRRRQARKQYSVGNILGAAAAIGLVGGIGSVSLTAEGRSRIAKTAHQAAVTFGWARARAPQAGDYWEGCDSARTAGTAPIYRGEPGYRTEMDGDNDGIACEPYY